jgi:hypothetical protein
MKAALYTRYGPPEVVELADTDKPSATEKQVLLRVTALQGLRRGGLDANTPPIQPRRKVLVNGASGAVGTPRSLTPLVPKSPACAAFATSNWSSNSAPPVSSTTPAKISPKLFPEPDTKHLFRRHWQLSVLFFRLSILNFLFSHPPFSRSRV